MSWTYAPVITAGTRALAGQVHDNFTSLFVYLGTLANAQEAATSQSDWGGAAGGTADALTAALTAEAAASLATGLRVRFLASATNTGAVTLDLDGLGATAVTKNGDTPLEAGDIVVGRIYTVEYDGARFQLSVPPAGPAGTIGTAADGSVSGPSFTFTLDPDTGLYRDGDGVVAVATNGVKTLELVQASQAEAEAGTNAHRPVSPLRVAQQTTARIASEAEALAGTDNEKLMTPLRSAQAQTGTASLTAKGAIAAGDMVSYYSAGVVAKTRATKEGSIIASQSQVPVASAYLTGEAAYLSFYERDTGSIESVAVLAATLAQDGSHTQVDTDDLQPTDDPFSTGFAVADGSGSVASFFYGTDAGPAKCIKAALSSGTVALGSPNTVRAASEVHGVCHSGSVYLTTLIDSGDGERVALAATESGGTFTFGSEASLSAAAAGSNPGGTVVWDAGAGKGLAIWTEGSALKAAVLTLAGTAIAVGAVATQADSVWDVAAPVVAAYEANAAKTVIARGDDIVVATISGTTVSFGTRSTQSLLTPATAVADPDLNRVHLISGDGAVEVSISGTDVVVEHEWSETLTGIDFSAAYDTANDVVGIFSISSAHRGRLLLPDFGFETRGDWIGVALTAAADTETAVVLSRGGAVANQSGLTAGSDHYLDADGSLTTSATDGFKAGFAADTDTLLTIPRP